MNLDELKKLRDEDFIRDFPKRNPTIVGEISGTGDRHVLRKTTVQASPMSPPGPPVILPEEGESSGSQPFQILDASDETTVKARVLTSTINGTEPSQFSSGEWVFTVSGYTEIYAHVTINSTGIVTATALGSGSSTPDDTSTEKYTPIGFVDVASASPPLLDFANYRYGPVQAQICRDWFSNPPTYGVNWL